MKDSTSSLLPYDIIREGPSPLKTQSDDVDTVWKVLDYSQTLNRELAGVKGSKGKLKVVMKNPNSWLLPSDVIRVDASPEDTV